MQRGDLRQSRLLKAARREAVDCTPVWLMRQAGRYLPEYRNLRTKHSLLTLCKTPELAAEVTLQPIRRFELDAAIIFADILLPIEPMGLHLEFAKGEGPVIRNPIASDKDVEDLILFPIEEGLGFVLDAIRVVVPELKTIPLIGFAGAPFTVASYIIEGGYSRHFIKTKQFMHHHSPAWHRLMEKLSTITKQYLLKQVEAGASIIQLFDSWAGTLGPEDYRNYVLPYSSYILNGMTAPSIHFSTGTAGYLDVVAEAGGDVIGVDWRIHLSEARRKIPGHAIQGNLDPAALLRPADQLSREVRAVLQQANGEPGHIFNLGHGVFPETPPENVELLVREVHQFRSLSSKTANSETSEVI